MPNIIRVALGLAVMWSTAFAQAANAPPKPLASNQAATSAESQQRQAETHGPQDADVRDTGVRNPNTRDHWQETGLPAIGPRTTQGLAQDAITRANGR